MNKMYESVIVPTTWAEKSYNNKPFYLVEMSNSSAEYMNIEHHFVNYDIISIERVQNPYQYGKYLLYRLQKNSPPEGIYFMPVRDKSHLDTALRFNCDYRRLNYSNDAFFANVSQAVSFNSSYNKLIVLHGLGSYMNHDSGRYPKYVVTFERDD